MMIQTPKVLNNCFERAGLQLRIKPDISDF